MRLTLISLLLASLSHAGVTCLTPAGAANGTWGAYTITDLVSVTDHYTCVGGTRPFVYLQSVGADSVTTQRDTMMRIWIDAHKGDTHLLQSGDTFPVGGLDQNSMIIGRLPGTGTFTVTSSDYAKLPPRGTRVTPAHKPLMATVQIDVATVATSLWAMSQYADDIEIRGINFEPVGNNVDVVNAHPFIRIGTFSGWQSNICDSGLPGWGFGSTQVRTTRLSVAAVSSATRVYVRNARGIQVGEKIAIGTDPNSTTCQILTVTGTNTADGTNHYIDFSDDYNEDGGLNANRAVGQAVHVLPSEANMPRRIAIRQNIFGNTGMQYQHSRHIVAQGVDIDIEDNFTDGVMDSIGNGDTQNIVSYVGPGPINIRNNYIGGNASEPIFFGDNPSYSPETFPGGTIEYNFIPHPPERSYVSKYEMLLPAGVDETWSTSPINIPDLAAGSPRLVFTGRHVVDGSMKVRAMSTGVVGPSKPDFSAILLGEYYYDVDPLRTNPAVYGVTSCPADSSGTQLGSWQDQDGDGVCWRRVSGYPLIKNNLEFKRYRDVVIRRNVFDSYGSMHPYNSSQTAALVIRIITNEYNATGEPCLNGLNFADGCYRGSGDNLLIESNIIRRFSGGINFYGAEPTSTVSTKYALPLASGNWRVRNNLFVQTEPNSNNWASYHWLNFFENASNLGNRAAPIPDISIENNTLYSPFTFNDEASTLNFGATWLTGTASFTNGSAELTGSSISISSSSVGKTIVAEGTSYTMVAHVSTSAVTLDRPYEGTSGSQSFVLRSGGFTGTRSFSGNILNRKSGTATSHTTSANSGSRRYDGGLVATDIFPGTSTGGVMRKNIVLAAQSATFPDANEVWTGCGEGVTVACVGDDADMKAKYATVFRSVNRVNADGTDGDFRLVSDHPFVRSMPGGQDAGANPDLLPEIRALRVEPTDRAILFRWRVTEPIKDIPCSIELHTAPDMETIGWHNATIGYVGEHAADQIETYYGMERDDYAGYIRRGLDRMIAVGHTVPLTADTTYYYRLHCGGDVRRGSVTTLPTLSGTATLPSDIADWGPAANNLSGGTVNVGSILYFTRTATPSKVEVMAIR